jgi:hypothetical protein
MPPRAVKPDLPVACPGCGGRPELYQPDTAQPDRLLAICPNEECACWTLFRRLESGAWTVWQRAKAGPTARRQPAAAGQ